MSPYTTGPNGLLIDQLPVSTRGSGERGCPSFASWPSPLPLCSSQCRKDGNRKISVRFCGKHNTRAQTETRMPTWVARMERSWDELGGCNLAMETRRKARRTGRRTGSETLGCDSQTHAWFLQAGCCFYSRASFLRQQLRHPWHHLLGVC